MSTREDDLDRIWNQLPGPQTKRAHGGDELDAIWDSLPGAPPARDPRDPLGIMPPEKFDPKSVAAQGDLLAQGATLGWSDELKALVKSLPALLPGGESPVEAFGRNLKVGEDALREERSAHPGAAAATELAGAALPAILSGGAAVGPQSVMRAAGTGAGIGAVAGAGSTDGGLADRFKGGLLGAGLGALFGGGTAAATRALGGAGRAVADVAGLRAPAEGGGSGAQKIAAKVLPIDSHAERADDLVLQALERDRIPLDALERRASERGRGEMLVDMGGENVRGLARAAQSFPGEGKEAIKSTLKRRARTEATRVRQSVERGLGVGGRNAIDTIDEVMARRRDAAAPLYERAYQASDVRNPAVLQQMMEKGVKYRPGQVADNDILEMLRLPIFREAYRTGSEIAEMNGHSIPLVWKAVGKGEDRRIVLNEYPTVRGLDLMKRGLDDAIERGMRGGKMGKQKAIEARKNLNALLDRLDQVVPEYGEARSVYRGDSAMLDALKKGQETITKNVRPELVSRTVGAMTDGEREMYRLGIADALRRRIARTRRGHSTVDKVFGNSELESVLRTAFPSEESFQRFAKEMEREIAKREVKGEILGGSQTTPRAIEATDASIEAVKNAATAASGNFPGLLSAVLNSSAMKAIRGQTEATMNEVTPRLLAGARSGDEIADILNRLRLRSQKKAVSGGVGRTLSRGAAAEGGLLSGGAQ